jgi:hypothetical protein
MKKFNRATLLLLFYLFMPATTKAADKFNYVLLENFPGFFKAGEVMTNLPLLITSLFSFAIWTVGIAAMFMIIIGGFQYIISAGNKSTAESGKKLMTDALLGLVAALFAWLFLYIINPDLIKINLAMLSIEADYASSAPVSGVGETSTSGVIPSGTMGEAAARQKLAAAGITVNKTCPDITRSDVTCLEGMPEKAIDDIIKFKNACVSFDPNCSIVITGGTEGGHSSHGIGKPKMDIRNQESVKKFIYNLKNSNNYSSYGLSQVCATNANSDLRYKCSYPEAAEHFHLAFNG